MNKTNELDWYQGYKAGVLHAHMDGVVDDEIRNPQGAYQEGFCTGFYAGQAVIAKAYDRGVEDGYVRGKKSIINEVTDMLAEMQERR